MINEKTYAQKIIRGKIDLSLSENPLGCSPLVLKNLKNLTVSDINLYPDTQEVQKLMAIKFKVKKDLILLGAGSEQLIKLIAQTFLKKNDLVFIQSGSFPIFTKECLLIGAKIKFINPLKVKMVKKAKIIFLCNPNNPTGEIVNPSIIKAICESNKESLVVTDEANGEFMKESFIENAVKTKNCIVLKTFSKAFGMAGLRIGFALGSEKLINKLKEAQQPFPVSSIACKLASIALKDNSFIKKTIKFIDKERRFLSSQLGLRNLKFSNSVTNNLFVKTPIANPLIPELRRLNVSVISGDEFPGMNQPGFRISIKDRKTNLLFLKNLDKALSCLAFKKLLPSKERS